MPMLPTKGNGLRYGQSDRKKDNNRSIQLGNIGGPQFNTIAVTSLDRN